MGSSVTPGRGLPLPPLALRIVNLSLFQIIDIMSYDILVASMRLEMSLNVFHK